MNIVHVEVMRLNPMATSQEEILQASRNLIRQRGWEAVSIRAVAEACGVSVGTIYNYFRSKDELIGASVESVWRDIFHHTPDTDAFVDVPACIQWLYRRMEYGAGQYPHFFSIHSLRFAQGSKSQGRERMLKTWQHIRASLCAVIRRDPRVRADAFNEAFSPEAFANVLFSLMLSAMLRQDYDPSAVLEIARRVLY